MVGSRTPPALGGGLTWRRLALGSAPGGRGATTEEGLEVGEQGHQLRAVPLEDGHDLHEGADAQAGTLDLRTQLGRQLDPLLVLLSGLHLFGGLALCLLGGLSRLAGLRLGLDLRLPLGLLRSLALLLSHEKYLLPVYGFVFTRNGGCQYRWTVRWRNTPWPEGTVP